MDEMDIFHQDPLILSDIYPEGPFGLKEAEVTGPVGLSVRPSKPLPGLCAWISVKVAHLTTGYSELFSEGKLDTEVPQRSSQISGGSERIRYL